MTLSLKELKLLWTPTGNLCAFPGCTQALVADDVVIGEMCHIFGENPGSNRYDHSKSPEFVDSHQNRIVLCPTHHSLIDKRELEDRFPVELLLQWKNEHAAHHSDDPMPGSLFDLVQKQFQYSVLQVAVNSPGAIQALGDVSVTHYHSSPALTLLDAEGDERGTGVFGQTATMVFGAKPSGALVNLLLEITVEGKIQTYEKCVTGYGTVQDTTSIGPVVDTDGKRFIWGQKVLNAGNFLRVVLHGSGDLGHIRYNGKTG